MSTTFGQDLIASLKEAVAHARGEAGAGNTHKIKVADAGTLRTLDKNPGPHHGA